MKISQLGTIFFITMCLSTTVTAKITKNKEPRDVEIGIGGNIKLEKPARTKLEEKFDWHTHLLVESLYITEGRDNLAGKSIASISSEFNYKDISIVPWVAKSITSNYAELNLNIVYAKKLLDELEIFAGYNYIQSRQASIRSEDNEISLDLVYFYKKRFQLLSSLYYSFDAKGSFMELALKKGYRISQTRSLDIQTTLGFNSGYIADGHNGINNLQLRANYSYQLMKEMDVYAYTSYSLAVNRDNKRYAGDELLRNVFWAGVGMSYRF